MSLRKSIVTTVSLTLVALIALLYVVTKEILLESFAAVEREQMRDDMARLERAIQAQANSLDVLVRDWAAWDDTYAFIRDGSSAFVDSNLGDQTLIDADLRFMIFLDSSGEIVFSKSRGDKGEPSEAPPSSLTDLLSTDGRWRLDNPTERIAGTLVLPDLALIAAARPIVTSEGEGPVRGTLFMARDLNGRMEAMLSRITSLDIGIERIDAAPGQPSSDDGIFFEVSEPDTITGSKVLTDLSDNRALRLEVTSPRPIVATGDDTLRFFLVSLIIVGTILIVLVALLLDRLVLLPISRLNRAVMDFRRTGDYTHPGGIPVGGELAQLSRSIESMFSDIRNTRTELENTNSRLERSVRERTEELVQARDAAVDALKTKERILANVGHDSRTPLNTIVLRAELMKTGRYGTISDEQSDALDSIIASVNQLTLFTTNLLYEAQAGTGDLSVKGETFILKDEISRILAMMRPLAERKTLDLSLVVDEHAPREIDINRHAFNQVISNLVDNAIKFTDDGEITIRVAASGDDHVALSVADTGRGIPEDLRSLIFDPFWQADGSVTRDINRGVGLGLSIVRLLVEHLRGTVEVRSPGKRGTEFVVTLPTGIPHAAAAAR